MDDDDWLITGLLAGACVMLGVVLFFVEIGRFVSRFWRWK
jgi:hypothetical protein